MSLVLLKNVGLNGKHGVFFLILVFIVLKGSLQNSGGILGCDFLWHVEYARYMLEHLSLPTKDWMSWSHPAGQITANQWLGELIVGIPYIIGGNSLSSVATAVLMAGILYFSWKSSSFFIKNDLVAFGSAFLTISPVLLLSARPQLLGMLFLSIVVYILTRYSFRHEITQKLWALPIVMVLWANSHGSFVVGVAYIAALGFGFWLKDAIKSKGYVEPLRTHLVLAIFSFGAVFATLLTPFGFGGWEYVYEVANLESTKSLIDEWKNTSISQPDGVFFFIVVSIAVYLMSVSEKKKDAFYFLAFAGTVYFGLMAFRQTYLAEIALVPLMAKAVVDSSLYPRLNYLNIRFNLIKSSLFAGLLSAILFYSSSLALKPVVDSIYDKNSVKFSIENGYSERMLTSMSTSSYLDGIGIKSFMDSRLDYYSDQMFLEFYGLMNIGVGVQVFFEKYHPNSVIAKPWQAFVKDPYFSSRYLKVFSDDVSALYVKNELVKVSNVH